jgi:RNA polymerase sigma factor (sigma-70 family)
VHAGGSGFCREPMRHHGNLFGASGVIGVVGGRPLSEHDLIDRAKRGDVGAYGELVRMHERIAFRTAYLITRDCAEAQDAAREAFIRAYRALWRFRPGAPFRPWLLRIVANESRNRCRSAARRATLAARAKERVAGDATPSLEATVLASERRDAVLAGLNALSEDHRSVIVCRYFLELSEAETAAALSCRRGTVKSRLSRALEVLRDAMEEPCDRA